jgi:carbon-monoxide dehydrogenase large subunit
VEVDYEELAPVIDMRTAAKGPALHDEAPDNHCYKWALGDKAAVDAAFASAAHVTKLDLVNNRLIPNAMEPRAANASYNRATDEYTLYVANQNPHVERLLMTAFVLGLPEHKVRVIAPDVGGGFGSKIFLYAEDVAPPGQPKLNRAIKWTAERSESFLTDAHGRDHHHAEMAMDKDGKFLAMRVHTDANLGAYLSTFASSVPTILYATLLAGQYTTPQIYVEVDGWFTNTAPVDAYRGAGRPEATYLLERLVSRCAWELGLTQDEIRKRNFITSFRTRRRWRCSTTRATTTPAWTRRSNWPTWPASRRAGRPARPRASSAASATAATSRPAAWRPATSPARWGARRPVRGRRGARHPTAA